MYKHYDIHMYMYIYDIYIYMYIVYANKRLV